MVVDPMAFMRQQVQQAHQGVQGQGGKVVDGPVFDNNGTPALHHLPQGPGSPGYLARIPPGEPDPGSTAPDPAEEDLESMLKEFKQMESAPALAAPVLRIAVNYGRREGTYAVAVEQSPDWENLTARVVSGDALLEMLPILRAMARIKDNTGELEEAERDYVAPNVRPQAPSTPRPRVSNDGPRQSKATPVRTDGDSPEHGAPDGPVRVGPDPHG